jgi:hypothetical protein
MIENSSFVKKQFFSDYVPFIPPFPPIPTAPIPFRYLFEIASPPVHYFGMIAKPIWMRKKIAFFVEDQATFANFSAPNPAGSLMTSSKSSSPQSLELATTRRFFGIATNTPFDKLVGIPKKAKAGKNGSGNIYHQESNRRIVGYSGLWFQSGRVVR